VARKRESALFSQLMGKNWGKSRVSWIYPGVHTFSKVRESLFLFVLWVSGDVTDGVAFGVLCFVSCCCVQQLVVWAPQCGAGAMKCSKKELVADFQKLFAPKPHDRYTLQWVTSTRVWVQFASTAG
jgi:hypothetical protein